MFFPAKPPSVASSDADVLEERSRVVVIGSDVFGKLFEPNQDPLDQTIRVNNITFRVIGVMEERGAGIGGVNLDEIALTCL